MKKTLILAMAITLVLTGSLFAANRRLVAEPNATFTPGVGIGGFGVAATGPTTTNNDDTCDISTAPAATLLLPYFRVNTTDLNTIFTIVNTSPNAQIAHITVWTDWSFPVLDFNVYLTGYDVQGLSLRDIIFNGVIAPTATAGVAGTTDTGSTTSGTGLSPYGDLGTQPTAVNPNFAGPSGSAAIACSNLPGSIGPTLTTAIQNALINGTYVIPGIAESCTSAQRVGTAAGVDALHPANTAVGYVTIDVANKCSLLLPTNVNYFRTDILFDNVLTGDFETFDASAASNYAGGTPLVHIRAIPEGGAAGVLPAAIGEAVTNLPYTFYSRYQSVGLGEDPRLAVIDRRQPLPAQFAARFTEGGGLSTSFNIWREGVTGNTTCANASLNAALTIAEIVRFDEHENFRTFSGAGGVSPSTPTGSRLNEASRVPVNNAVFPVQPTTAGDVGGWMYLNLDNGSPVVEVGQSVGAGFTVSTNNPLYPAGAYPAGRPSQNWVVVSMTGSGASAGALSVDFDATWLGNGCSPVAGQSNANGGADLIGPAPNVNP